MKKKPIFKIIRPDNDIVAEANKIIYNYIERINKLKQKNKKNKR